MLVLIYVIFYPHFEACQRLDSGLATNKNPFYFAGGASSPQLVVSLPPLNSTAFTDNGASSPFPPLPQAATSVDGASSSSASRAGAVGGCLGGEDGAGATTGGAASIGSPMSLTEDELQHERNAFAENVSLGLYQPTPIPASAGGGAGSKSQSNPGAAGGKRGDGANANAANDGDAAGNDVGSECTVCYERAVDSVLYTCGHCCMCYECAWECKHTRGGLCPICRAPIRDIIRIYRS